MKRRTLDALSVLVVGLGVILFLLAPCADVYSLGHGLVALVGTWVLGHTLRTYLLGFVDDRSGDAATSASDRVNAPGGAKREDHSSRFTREAHLNQPVCNSLTSVCEY